MSPVQQSESRRRSLESQRPALMYMPNKMTNFDNVETLPSSDTENLIRAKSGLRTFIVNFSFQNGLKPLSASKKEAYY